MEFAHALLAGGALVLGAAQLLGPKGTVAHRWTGRVYLGVMGLTALSSFGLTSMTGGFSFLHILSVWVLFTLAQNVWLLRRGNIAGHALSMLWLYGGLLTAGVLAAQRHGMEMPGPLMIALMALVWGGVILLSIRLRRRFQSA